MQMLRMLKLIPLVLLLVAAVQALAQNAPAPIPNPDARLVKQVGDAGAFYYRSKDLVKGGVFFYAQGTVDDVYQQKDVVTLTFSFQVSGTVLKRPDIISLSITTKSREAKYSNNHRLRLLAENKAFLDKDTIVLRVRNGGTAYATETFSLDALTVEDLEKLAKKKNAVLEFGGTRLTLTPEAQKRIQDFYDLVKG